MTLLSITSGLFGLLSDLMTVALIYLTAQSLTQLAVPRVSHESHYQPPAEATSSKCATKSITTTFVQLFGPGVTGYNDNHFVIRSGSQFDHNKLAAVTTEWFDLTHYEIAPSGDPYVAFDGTWAARRWNYSSVDIGQRKTGDGVEEVQTCNFVPDIRCRQKGDFSICYDLTTLGETITSVSVTYCGENHNVESRVGMYLGGTYYWGYLTQMLIAWSGAQTLPILSGTLSCEKDVVLNQEYLVSAQHTTDSITVWLSYGFLVIFATSYLLRLMAVCCGAKDVIVGNTIMNKKDFPTLQDVRKASITALRGKGLVVPVK